MNQKQINRELLDRVVAGQQEDIWYHYGISSRDPLLQQMRDVEAVVIAGSGERVKQFARNWSKRRQAPVLSLSKEERFVFRYADKVIFSSHGMGMASASIALQELMKMMYFLKAGDPAELDKVLWMRGGTSGGLGLTAGTLVISTEGLQVDLKPYRIFDRGQEYYFNASFPETVVHELTAAAVRLGMTAVSGRTVGGNDFYLEQARRDGAVSLVSEEEKMVWLQELHRRGVRNIEMETPMVAGLLNHWGFPRFAAVCTVLLDRLQGDQVTATTAQLEGYVANVEQLLGGYLAEVISR